MPPLIRSFDQRAFLVLPENRLAVAAVRKLGPEIKRRRVRLVSIIGPPGVGKSHLAHELLRSWESEKRDGKLLSITASQFAAQVAEAADAGTLHQFQSRYRNNVSLLICEDLQALGPRKESQQQFVSAIDTILSNGGVVLLSSSLMPGAIKGLSRRLVNRMHGGVCVNLELPGPESRRELIQQFLSRESLPLTAEEIETIVKESPPSPRELIGLLTQLQTEMKLRSSRRKKNNLNLSAALADRQRQTKLGLPEIARATAASFGVKLSDMKGPGRSQTLSLARQTAMYLARELAQLHYITIGKFFNRSNHSTVIHACQKIAQLQEADAALARQIQTVQEELIGS